MALGPEGYFKIVMDEWKDGRVAAWHVEDAQGNKSVVFRNDQAENIDLLLGKGRAIVGLLAYIGRETLETMYNYLSAK